MIKKICFILYALLYEMSNIFAQPNVIENSIHESGKIYVVVAVIVTIFLGIVIYLISIDKKVRKMEKEMKD